MPAERRAQLVNSRSRKILLTSSDMLRQPSKISPTHLSKTSPSQTNKKSPNQIVKKWPNGYFKKSPVETNNKKFCPNDASSKNKPRNRKSSANNSPHVTLGSPNKKSPISSYKSPQNVLQLKNPSPSQQNNKKPSNKSKNNSTHKSQKESSITITFLDDENNENDIKFAKVKATNVKPASHPHKSPLNKPPHNTLSPKHPHPTDDPLGDFTPGKVDFDDLLSQLRQL